MTDPSDSPATIEFSCSLDGQAVISAAASFYGPNSPASVQLKKGLRRLVASNNWPDEIVRLERLGLSARHFAGELEEALHITGDLVLLRSNGNGYSLLRYLEKRWLSLSEDGTPLPEEIKIEHGEPVEAVVMKLPQTGDKAGGFASLSALWPEVRAAWAEMGIASLFINAGQLLLPIFALLIYDKIALNGLFETLWALVLGMAIYLATDAGMRLIRSVVMERISTDLLHRSDETLWSRMIAQVDLPPGGFSRFLSNYRDLTLARDFVSSSYLLSVADIPFLLLYLAFIGIIAWPLMIVTIILAILYGGISSVLYKKQNSLFREAEQKNTIKVSFMGEALGCLDIIRTAPGAGSFLRTWRTLTEDSTDVDVKRRLSAHKMQLFSTTMQTVTSVVILTVGVYLIYAQMLTIGKLIACNILAGRAMAQVASLFAVTTKREAFLRAAASMEKSLEPAAEHECIPRPEISGNISVIRIGKHYEGRPAALENVSFNAKPGERIALLGRPGAGKSTLLRCLAGLSHPDTGHIQIDGIELDNISRFDRVKWLAYKGQDPALFAGTLEDNLRIAGSRDQNRFAGAIWASGLESEFQSGRMSLGMTLEEGGKNLSGGQRQKVALARAFAQPSRIMLLDEPTLGLDPESEKMLSERLPKLMDVGTVLIMSTHSPVLLRMIQRIIALDGGKVVADGPREKLVTLPQEKA